MNVTLEISIGEFYDKITILEIKKARSSDLSKLININKELAVLHKLLAALPISHDKVNQEVAELRQINAQLWAIEDNIRDKEAKKQFDQVFIDLARAVYITNDRRAAVKRDINLKLGSDFIEEKFYEKY